MKRILGFVFPVCLLVMLAAFATGLQPDWLMVWVVVIGALICLAVLAPIVKATLRYVLK